MWYNHLYGTRSLFILGFAAIVLFLVAAMRSYFLRRYRALIDPDAPNSLDDGCIRGIYMERRTEIGLIPPVQGISQPSKVQIAMETTVPVGSRRTGNPWPFAVRKVAGVVGDRKLGIEDLDRRSRSSSTIGLGPSRSSSDPRRGKASTRLADLGADFVLLTSGNADRRSARAILLLRGATGYAASWRPCACSPSWRSRRSRSRAPTLPGNRAEVTPLRDATLEPLHTWPTSRPSARIIFLARLPRDLLHGDDSWVLRGRLVLDFNGTVPGRRGS